MPLARDVTPELRVLVMGGVGAAITDALAVAGAEVAVVDVDEARAKSAADSAAGHGRNTVPSSPTSGTARTSSAR
jgi:Trk K+ transport system NAD-binding subunit